MDCNSSNVFNTFNTEKFALYDYLHLVLRKPELIESDLESCASNDMGGYVLLFKDTESYAKAFPKIMQFYNLKELEYEYSDNLTEGRKTDKHWWEELYLLSSDDVLVLIHPRSGLNAVCNIRNGCRLSGSCDSGGHSCSNLKQVKRMIMSNAMLFILGFIAIKSVYEIAVTGKRTKSEKVKKFGEQISKRK